MISNCKYGQTISLTHVLSGLSRHLPLFWSPLSWLTAEWNTWPTASKYFATTIRLLTTYCITNYNNLIILTYQINRTNDVVLRLIRLVKLYKYRKYVSRHKKFNY